MLLAVAQLLLVSTARSEEISQRELMQRLDMNAPPFIFDVRRGDEFASGHVPGAVNIPHNEIVARLDELSIHRDKEIVIYCESGKRAAIAQGILEKAGFTRIRHLQGDMRAWRERGLPHEQAFPAAAPDVK